MKVLMIYPKYPDTYWSFTQALKFISKKAAVPPLGLITVSAMLPENWADYVFLNSMYVQKESVIEILAMCKDYPVKVIAGGPLFTQEYNNYPQIDHFILNEAEITLPLFLSDLQNGSPLKRIYQTDKYALKINK